MNTNPNTSPSVSLYMRFFRLLQWFLVPLSGWLDQLDIRNPKLAHLVIKLIPAQCPFERDIHIGQWVLFHIPPLCKLNPLYDQFISLRFRALCYLAEECGEDIRVYC